MIMRLLVYWGILSLVYILPRADAHRTPGEVAKNGIQPEPTCEELKAMWRFSKRQSRASEITNELPMYPDPLVENIWQPFYATSRSIGGRRLPVSFGKVAYGPSRKISPEHLLPYLHYGTQFNQPRRRPSGTSFRLPGGGHLIAGLPQSGSFNHLKELIKTERARELQHQRLLEESAARAAAKKELGKNLPGRYSGEYFTYDDGEPQEVMLSDDIPKIRYEEEERQPDGLIAFPDLLAPSARFGSEGQVARFVPEYVPYTRLHGGGHLHPNDPSAFHASSFRLSKKGGFDGYIF